MNLDPTTGGSAAVGAMLSVLLAHYGGGEFTAPEMTALAAGFGAIVAAVATAIRAMWRKYEETPTNA